MKIVIVTAGTGQGHRTAARALADALAPARPGAAVAVISADEGNPWIAAGAGLYNFFLRRPPRWMEVFYAAVHACRLDRLGARLTAAWADRVLASERPDLVVSVHPMFNFAVADALRRSPRPAAFAVILTDPCPPFWKGWAEPRAALTSVATPEAARQLEDWGVPSGRVKVLGMPVPPALRREPTDKARARLSLGLDPSRFTLLIHAGSSGRRTCEQALRRLVREDSLHGRIQVVFAAGRSRRLARRAAALRAPFPALVLGWREDAARLLSAADAVFTKPGGLTVFEALSMGVPVLADALDGIMPQERGTARWLKRQGLGWVVERPGQLAGILKDTSEADWKARGAKARRLAAGDASSICSELLALA